MYFLQYEGDPSENSPSFALESDKCFSRIVPAFPVTVPSSSITTTCTSSNLELRAAAKLEVPGLSAILFQFMVVLVNAIDCESNQSTFALGVPVPVATPALV